MANHVDWIAAAIARARQQATSAPEAVWSELESLLKDKLSQKPLSAKELAAIAMKLIEKTNSTNPRPASREN